MRELREEVMEMKRKGTGKEMKREREILKTHENHDVDVVGSTIF